MTLGKRPIVNEDYEVRKPKNHMILTVFLAAAGYHREAWRMPGSRAEELGRLSLVKDLVQMAEASKVDSVFLGDQSSGAIFRDNQAINSSGLNEPISVLSSLAQYTSRIGLSGTISTTYSLPYQTARQLNGLDAMSNGRAGWNIVTSFSGGENFGLDELPPREVRYGMAYEFVDACVQLWDSWSDDAVVVDREGGYWVDPKLVRDIDFEGEYYRVKGPLNMRRSPQGRPVLFQAGQSEAGMRLGARFAEGIYTTQNNMQDSMKTVAAYKPLLEAVGRRPDSLKVLPGILPILGETRAEAQDYADYLTAHINWDLGALGLSRTTGIDLSQYDFDDRIPHEAWEASTVARNDERREIYRQMSENDRLTIRELITHSARTGGHQVAIGTASDVADIMIEWFENEACHGFNLNPPSMPDGLEKICTLLVPELQSRGYFREEYEGTTLREHMGLPYPPAWDKQQARPGAA